MDSREGDINFDDARVILINRGLIIGIVSSDVGHILGEHCIQFEKCALGFCILPQCLCQMALCNKSSDSQGA